MKKSDLMRENKNGAAPAHIQCRSTPCISIIPLITCKSQGYCRVNPASFLESSISFSVGLCVATKPSKSLISSSFKPRRRSQMMILAVSLLVILENNPLSWQLANHFYAIIP